MKVQTGELGRTEFYFNYWIQEPDYLIFEATIEPTEHNVIPRDFEAKVNFMLAPEDHNLERNYPKWQYMLPNLPGLVWYESMSFNWTQNGQRDMS